MVMPQQVAPGDQDIAYLCDAMQRAMGMVITPDKSYLFGSRLEPVLRLHQLRGLPELASALRLSQPDSPIWRDVVEAMTINETFFFREQRMFDVIRNELLPALKGQAGVRRHLRFWSAAASTGQESYSLGMSLLEAPNIGGEWRYDILGTDISRKVLERAQQGLYSQYDVQRGIPTPMLLKYFQPQAQGDWKVSPTLQGITRFRYHNLMEDLSPPEQFDLILCRNVLIYFDDLKKVAVLRRLCRQLVQGGMLITAGTESLSGFDIPLREHPSIHGVYILK